APARILDGLLMLLVATAICVCGDNKPTCAVAGFGDADGACRIAVILAVRHSTGARPNDVLVAHVFDVVERARTVSEHSEAVQALTIGDDDVPLVLTDRTDLIAAW